MQQAVCEIVCKKVNKRLPTTTNSQQPSAEAAWVCPTTKPDQLIFNDLRFIVKLKEKGAKDCVHNLLAEMRLKKVDKAVDNDPEVPSVTCSDGWPKASGYQWKHRVNSTRVLKSGDIEIITCTVYDVDILVKTKQWVTIFGVEAYVQTNIYGIIAHGIKMQKTNIVGDTKIRKTAQAFATANIFK